MRKQTKLVAVLSAAALLAVGASMTSFAATGWQEENGTWVYYDKDGYQVTDQWAKSGDNWFYLNGDGEMATDELIDDGNNYYYVDANGAMVANQWVAIENESAGEEDEPDAFWYYFQANGKAYKSTENVSWKTINGKKYGFDSEGKMLFGWVNKDASRATGDLAWQSGDFFCGDENDGARASGWAKIDVVDDDGEDQSYWFYFSPSNGTKTVDSKAKGINGKKYAFNEYGVMQSKWYHVDASASTASVGGYSYYNSPDEGWRLQKGWVKAVPAKDVDPTANENEDTNWYYADGSGNVYHSVIKTINSKKYAFNEKGAMLSGLWALKTTSGGEIAVDNDGKIVGLKIDNADKIDDVKDKQYDGYDIYYFGGGDDGAAKTGNQTIDIDGDNYTYTFGTAGSSKFKGEQTTEVGKSTKAIYVRGQKVKADKDYRYEAVDLSGNTYHGKDAIGKFLVNTSGSLMKNKKSGVKDTDDWKYVTNEVGEVTEATQE